MFLNIIEVISLLAVASSLTGVGMGEVSYTFDFLSSPFPLAFSIFHTNFDIS